MKIAGLVDSHDNNFNLIRFIAAYCVLISHSFVLVHGNNLFEPFNSSIGYSLGTIAVDIFFISSGFLVTASLLRRGDIKSFVKARALRIYPALIVVALFTALILGPIFSTSSLSEYFTNAIPYKFVLKNSIALAGIQHKLPGVFENNPFNGSVNGSLWTLPFELKCYISIGLLWVLLKNTFSASETAMKLMVTACTVIAFALLQLSNFEIIKPGHGYHLFFMFFFGATFFVWRKHIALTHRAAFLFFSVLALGVLKPDWFIFTYPISIAYVTLYIAYVPAGVIRGFNKLGDYSYGLYVYAFAVQQSLISVMPLLSVKQMIVYASVISILLAMLSWHFVEKPALRYK